MQLINTLSINRYLPLKWGILEWYYFIILKHEIYLTNFAETHYSDIFILIFIFFKLNFINFVRAL